MEPSTYPADKAIGMPLRVQCRDIVLHDGTIAAIALGCKHLKVIGAAIGFAITLMETILTKLLATLGTEEMLRMPGLIQCGHTLIQYGTIAVRTTWTEEIMIIWFTVGESITLKEVTCAQLLTAMIACKVLRMPSLAQCGNHLTHNRLLACIAATLLYCVNTLTTHIGL